MFAAASGHQGVLEELLRGRVDLSLAGDDGDTPAFQAAENGHSGVICGN